MRIEVVVPQIGEAVSELMLTQWLKQPGDAVQVGDVLFEIDSDKAIVEVEAFTAGTLVEITHGDGSAVMPLQVVAYIETEAVSAAAADVPGTPKPTLTAANGNSALKVSPLAERLAADLSVDLARVSGTGPGGRITTDDVRRYADMAAPTLDDAAVTSFAGVSADSGSVRPLASPKARRLARERGVDLTRLAGTGVDGMIIVKDVERAAISAAPMSPASRTRQIIAQRMSASKQQVPHFYLMAEVNMTQAQALRAYCAEVLRWEKAPTYTDIFVRACALALAAVPEVNRSYQPEGIVPHESISIGVAVSSADGLVVPTIPNADRLSLRQTSEALRDVAARARDKRLRPADLGTKSMTISNLGMYRVDAFVAIIDMPDPMILAVGRAADRAVAVNKQVVVQPMCTLTLSVDHRALDGALAAQFLERVIDQIEQPFGIVGAG
jgi:pyruvate dehydrogenase E2 component (dihydrolipoamide acetyltransferase)